MRNKDTKEIFFSVWNFLIAQNIDMHMKKNLGYQLFPNHTTEQDEEILLKILINF